MRHHFFLVSRVLISVAFCMPIVAGIAFSQEFQVPEDYRIIEGRLAGGFQPCLEQAKGNYESSLACSRSIFDECREVGPSGDTTAGLAICSSVSAKILDAEMNVVWAHIKKGASASEFAELLEEQRAWLRMRTRDSEAATRRYEGGSMSAYSGGVAYVGMTAERLARLHEIAANI